MDELAAHSQPASAQSEADKAAETNHQPDSAICLFLQCPSGKIVARSEAPEGIPVFAFSMV